MTSESLPNSEGKLPANLSNIVGQYESSTNYLTLSNTNPLARTQILVDELSNIDLDIILQFKLATQLANNFDLKHKKYLNLLMDEEELLSIPDIHPDTKTLIGIFMPLLNIYPYEYLDSDQIFDTLPHPIQDYRSHQTYIKIIYYIEALIQDQENIIFASLFDTDYVLGLLDFEYKKRLSGYDESKLQDIFYWAYTNMKSRRLYSEDIEAELKKYPIIYTTISISNYIPLFEKYIDASPKNI